MAPVPRRRSRSRTVELQREQWARLFESQARPTIQQLPKRRSRLRQTRCPEATDHRKTLAESDALGTTGQLTDGSGATVGVLQYDAFGNVRQQTGTQSSFGYTGEQQDPESGLVYLRGRYLAPATGRFLTPDPAAGSTGRPGSLHKYAYASNNPLRFIDPRGRDDVSTDDGGSARPASLDPNRHEGSGPIGIHARPRRSTPLASTARNWY